MTESEKKELCKKIILEAGARLKEAANVEETEKTDYKNLVTQYDKATQNFLMKELVKVYPGATFICEEDDVNDVSGEYFFVIDPIDGTANFTKGYRMSAISVALAKRQKLIWGIVYNPYNEEVFEAEAEKGAFLNGKRIQTGMEPLKHSLVAFGTSPYYAELKKQSFAIAEKMMDYAMDIRRSGSAALDLCYAACGRNGLYFEMRLSPWDFAGGMLILQEAGGTVTDFAGNVPDFTRPSGIIAGNPVAVEDYFAAFGKITL